MLCYLAASVSGSSMRSSARKNDAAAGARRRHSLFAGRSRLGVSWNAHARSNRVPEGAKHSQQQQQQRQQQQSCNIGFVIACSRVVMLTGLRLRVHAQPDAKPHRCDAVEPERRQEQHVPGF